jgi:hypothetical protein
MPLFVDHTGMNSLISDEINTTTNTRTIENRTSNFQYSLNAAAGDPALEGVLYSSDSFLNVPFTSASFSFWVKLDNVDTDNRVVYEASNDDFDEVGERIKFYNNELIYTQYDDTSPGDFLEFKWAVTMSDFLDWKNVTITTDGDFTNKITNLYIDGVSQGAATENSSSTPPAVTRYTSDRIALFNSYVDLLGSSTSPGLEGSMQSFVIYDIPLSQEDVTIIYNSGSAITNLSSLPSGSDIRAFYLLGEDIVQNADRSRPENVFDDLYDYDVDLGFSIPNDYQIESQVNDDWTLQFSASTGQQITLQPGVIPTIKGANKVGYVSDTNELAALNTHRNGPYGYSSWKQMRVSENPITRNHKRNSNFSFVTQPGDNVNVYESRPGVSSSLPDNLAFHPNTTSLSATRGALATNVTGYDNIARGFSVSFWLYVIDLGTAGYGTQHRVVTGKDSSGNYSFFILLGETGFRVYVQEGASDDFGKIWSIAEPINPPPGYNGYMDRFKEQWFHFGVSWNGIGYTGGSEVTSPFRFYLNGVDQGEPDSSDGSFANASYNMNIPNDINLMYDTTGPTLGALQAVGIWGVTQPASFFREAYNSGTPPSFPPDRANIIDYWPLDGAPGYKEVGDSIPNNTVLPSPYATNTLLSKGTVNEVVQGKEYSFRNSIINRGGDFIVRKKYSDIKNFTEPVVCQKTYPLVWNVGRHFMDSDGNLNLKNLNKFSIISSYANQQIGFANEEVNKLLKFRTREDQSEYSAIKDMYLENGLNKQDSPLTYWEFLQYRETVFPKEQQQFVKEVRDRPQFESFYRHNREDRTFLLPLSGNSFDFPSTYVSYQLRRSSSTWPLDVSENFLTEDKISDSGIAKFQNKVLRHGGILNSPFSNFDTLFAAAAILFSFDNTTVIQSSADAIDEIVGPLPTYSRRPTLTATGSVSNPSGLEIYGVGSSVLPFEGYALWEAGDKRQVKDSDGNYISAPKYPFYDTYENYVEDVRKLGKNYSVIPEFRMSTQVEDYKKTDNAIELDMFEVTGGIAGSEDSSKQNFYEIYSNSDFMKNFEVISSDHEDFTNGKVLSLRCKAIKKFLPYEGFYPCQRTVDLAKRFHDSYSDFIKFQNSAGTEIPDFNFGVSNVSAPLFAPGVLFNTIKSGVAVDYPIITGSLNAAKGYHAIAHIANEYFIHANNFDKRIPFEAIIEPKKYLKGYKLTGNEPHPSGNLSSSAVWDGQGDEFYSMMANNFIAEIPEFFLPKGQLTSIVSKEQRKIRNFKEGEIYGMRVSMRRSMDKTRISVYHSGSEETPYIPPQDIILTGSKACRETFTMYSRPSAFGPPTYGYNTFSAQGYFSFDEARFFNAGSLQTQIRGSEEGYNFPFTPPYYHGEGWCEMWLTASSAEMTIAEIQNAVTTSFKRFDDSFYLSKGAGYIAGTGGPQSNLQINQNAVQLSASLNLFGIGTVETRAGQGAAGSLIVDTAIDENSRWVIQTKFETPMLNFNHVSGSDHLTLPNHASESVPRGMWHQHGRIPEENEGVFLDIGPIPNNYQNKVLGRTQAMNDLSEHLGFSSTSTKLGRLAPTKTISEAVVAVPFVEEGGRKKFFKLDPEKVRLYKEGDLEKLTQGAPNSQIGRSVLLQMDKMKKFIFPPSFDFLNFDDVTPVAMYIFEFSHVLTQQDLSDIWQNLPPDIGTEMEVAEVAITHPVLKKELLGPGGKSGNDTIEMPNKLKWMVFKVKQRAASNYFKKTVLRNPLVNKDVDNSNVTKDEFGETTAIQYNWPYDFFSLVEMVKIDAEVEMGNADFSNYTDVIPRWNAVVADSEKIEETLQGMESGPVPEVFPVRIEEEEEIELMDVEDEVESFQENREVAASAGQKLVQGSIEKAQTDAAITEAIVSQTIAENENLVAGGAAMGGLLGGVDFRDFDSLRADVGASAIIVQGEFGEWGQPTQDEESFSAYTNVVNVAAFTSQISQAQQNGASRVELRAIMNSYGINESFLNNSQVTDALNLVGVSPANLVSIFRFG